MNKFTIKLFKFLFPFIILVLPMEFLLRQIPNDYKYKKNYLDKNSNKIEVLFLGSSHAFYGLNPFYCTQNCFNASHISQPFKYDLEILKKYEHNWYKLKIVVLPISYFSLFQKLETGSEAWRVKNYIIYYEINTSNDLADHTEMLSNKLGVNLRRIASYYIKGNTAISCSTLGWCISCNSKNARNLVETGKTAAKRHTNKDFKYMNENVSILKSIIEFGQRYNIKIVLITLPAYKTYVANLNKEQLKKTVQTAENISNQFENCFYFNFLENKSFSELDFYDADHLNEIGAKRLTLLIDKIIIDKVENTNVQ